MKYIIVRDEGLVSDYWEYRDMLKPHKVEDYHVRRINLKELLHEILYLN